MVECKEIMKNKKLIRPKKDRKIAGVCAGLANYFHIDLVWVRIVWLLLLVPGGLPGVLPYIIFWIAMPSEK